MNALDYIAELALIEASRVQRKALEIDIDAIDEWKDDEDE